MFLLFFDHIPRCPLVLILNGLTHVLPILQVYARLPDLGEPGLRGRVQLLLTEPHTRLGVESRAQDAAQNGGAAAGPRRARSLFASLSLGSVSTADTAAPARGPTATPLCREHMHHASVCRLVRALFVQDFQCELQLTIFPTDTFTTLELRNQLYDVSELHKFRRSPDLEALKL